LFRGQWLQAVKEWVHGHKQNPTLYFNYVRLFLRVVPSGSNYNGVKAKAVEA